MSITKNEHLDTEEVRKLANPFQRDETVVIPMNTPYTTTAPGKQGLQYSKRQQVIKLVSVNNAYVLDQKDGMVYTRDATVGTAGTGGYWKNFVLTPDVLHANGKSVEMKVLREAR